MLLNDADRACTEHLFNRAEEVGMEKICAFAVLQTSELLMFNNFYAIEIATKILGSDNDFLHMIVSPKEKKKFLFTERNILERFFSENRKTLLKEVKYIENTEYGT